MAHWHATRTKIQLKLAIQRSRMLQEKKAALHKKVRLEIAELVERHKLESARVKTESLIMDDIHLELLELLELYCETHYARFGLLEGRDNEPDDAIREPMIAIIHAAHRTEVKELHVLQNMLSARYSTEFSEAALQNTENCVSERITRKLAFHLPPPEMVDAYLSEICKAYQVPFGQAPTPLDTLSTDAVDHDWHTLVQRFDALKRTHG